MNVIFESIDQIIRDYAYYVWMGLTLFAVPFMVSARFRKTYPSTVFILLALVTTAMTFLLLRINNETLLFIILIADAATLLIATGDLFTLPKNSAFTAERKLMRIASIQKPHPVSLTINNHTKSGYSLLIKDGVPQVFEVDEEEQEFSIQLAGQSRVTKDYDLIPTIRGAYELKAVYIQVQSFFGLWKKYIRIPLKNTINVYPDMKQLSEYALLSRTNRLSMLGVRRTRKIGQDNEFERLRDYTPDDNYKHIDWRSTARRNKLTVKDFQTNHSQRIIFLIDCGRMMTNISSGISLLDHSLNAMLMLSYVALQKGDSVGMICFSDQVHAYVPPRGGMNQMNQLLHACFDREATLVESRYEAAFLHLNSFCKKRSMVVLISNVIDEVNSLQIEQYLTNLVGRHLPLGVLLRDHKLFDAADNAPSHGSELFRGAAAAEILTWRHQVLTDLEHRGVLVLDVFPEDMTAPLINSYLNIKARHLL
ncbi:MAG: hypothetical protein ACI9HK_001810 [Pirellulaceae bacterium]